MKTIREIESPGPIYAEDFNALAAEVRRLGMMFGDGIDVDQEVGGPMLRVKKQPERITVRVYAEGSGSGGGSGHGFNFGTGSGIGLGVGEECDDVSYSWIEQIPGPCGQWFDDPHGRSGAAHDGTSAFERNGFDVPDGSVVEITTGAVYLDDDDNTIEEWTFNFGDSATGSGIITENGILVALTAGPASGSGTGACDNTYFWQAAVADKCGILGVDPFGLTGTAFEQNRNRVPIMTNGNNTIVRIFPAPVPPGTNPIPYVFDYPMGLEEPACVINSGSESGSNAESCADGATPVSCLFDCTTVRDGCWGVLIGSHIYPVIVTDGSGTDITGT